MCYPSATPLCYPLKVPALPSEVRYESVLLPGQFHRQSVHLSPAAPGWKSHLIFPVIYNPNILQRLNILPE